MKLQLRFRQSAAIPRMGWIARVRFASGVVDVLHGARVECHGDWYVEGAWDGEFSRGGFVSSESFFGSGGRIEGSSLVVAASTSLTDRLLYCSDSKTTWISNSIVLILAAIDGGLVLEHDYTESCHASVRGIFHYPRTIAVDSQTTSSINQLLHGNLRVGADGSSEETRTRRHSIDTYAQYVSMLHECASSISRNATASGRRVPLVGVTTLSTGYDSAAVSTIVRSLGVDVCFTTAPADARGAREWENGVPIARALGYEPRLLGLPSGVAESEELHFLAPTFDGSELILNELAQYVSSLPGGAIVWTGYHGDKVWDLHTEEAYLGDDILRGDTSGLNLSEIRLKTGFINVALPFVHARSIGDLIAIAKSADMERWRLGSEYDRPIPRRIVESAGVERSLFGHRKRVVMKYRNLPHNRQLRAEFLTFVKERTPYGWIHAPKQEWLSKVDYLLQRLEASRMVPSRGLRLKHRFIPRHADLQQLMFKWAVNRLVAEYRPALADWLHTPGA